MSRISKAEERRRAAQSATDKANAAKRKEKALTIRPSRLTVPDFAKIAREHMEKMIFPTGGLFPSVSFREIELEPKPPAIDTTVLAALTEAEPYRPVKRPPDYVHVLTGMCRAWRIGGVR